MRKQKDYCPYAAHTSAKREPDPSKGIALMMGEDFIIVPRSVLKRQGIPVRKTGRELCIGDKCKPLYEKANWDCCHELNMLFYAHKDDTFKVADYAVTEVITVESGIVTRYAVEW